MSEQEYSSRIKKEWKNNVFWWVCLLIYAEKYWMIEPRNQYDGD